MTPAIDIGTPVSFSCEGSRLRGSLHTPSVPGGRTGVILLNQGPIDRAGSHRLYIKLAARLVALGMPVLRFDARGVGESEGQWAADKISVLEAYGNIQRGAWVPDTLAAIEYMRQTVQVDEIVLAGLCGGACTAVFAGADNRAVSGIVAIGAPVTFSAVTQQVADLPDAVIEHHAGRYIRKILQPSSWARFLSLQTDYRTLLGVFGTALRRRLLRGGQADRISETDAKINVPMINAIRSAARTDKKLLFVFGGNDYLWQEFQEQLPRFGADRTALPFDLVTIDGANHILTEESWQEALYEAMTSWLSAAPSAARRRSA